MQTLKVTVLRCTISLFILMAAATSCKKQNSGQVANCSGNFTGVHCDSCIAGYEGADCNTRKYTKFLGTYQGNDVCGSSTYADTWSINAGTQLDALSISVAGATLNATFSGNSFTAPAQDAGNLRFSSLDGNLNGNTITINYTYTNTTGTHTCTFTGTK